ncbi:MarR family transcriptional regulator [Salipiger sp. P9]|uniref:MarR family transcriptional regulator n=1 Tax=Salipiger pentaromativorans TaxID=2943193 RepID=UPI0021582245|nr:MarR family transcriptional regulator [Salipiger pentaromativorans]MCR8547070.1 MarR family transcriptional regulator [Salipiger pentaromativorans]
MQRIAVLTGDIVDSSELSASALDATMAALRVAVQDISTWPGPVAAGFARRGGDGWQMACDRPERAMRAALYLQASLRRLDRSRATRIALAVGAGSLSPTDLDDPNSAHGPVFTTSGRLLESLSGHRLMAHASGGAEAAALRLADHISQGWTPAQARALCEMLPPGTGPRAEAAERLGITRQAVNQALWSAGFPALDEALSYLETVA